MNPFRNQLRVLALCGAASALLGCMASQDPARVAKPAEPGASEPEEPEQPGARAGAPGTAAVDPATTPTHSGLVSIQDVSIANLPAAGHGLTVNAFFTPWAAPDYEEKPGELGGCRVWSYDVVDHPPPPEEDQGALQIAGVRHGDLRCVFQSGRGYVCPTASGQTQLATAPGMAGSALYGGDDARFEASQAGRYLLVEGALDPANNGAFPILAVTSPSQLIVLNPRVSAERFAARYTVLAGAGPTPGAGFAPFEAGRAVEISLEGSGEGGLGFDATAIMPGAELELTAAARTAIQHVPVSGEALTLACERCGPAPLTIVRLSTTDADLTGASAVAMPRALHKQIEIQCAAFDAEQITIPVEAMQHLHAAHAASPITRIRTAFMRDGYALHQARAPEPPNRVVLVAGHGVLGFSQP